MRPHDLVVEAFASELADLEKRAGAGMLLGAGLTGMAALPVMKSMLVGKMRAGQQDFGDYSRPQFERRFGQHMPPATLTEELGMLGGSLANFGNKAGGEAVRAGIKGGRQIADMKPLQTAQDMWTNRDLSYVRSNLGN
jgi:hypothetical protein